MSGFLGIPFLALFNSYRPSEFLHPGSSKANFGAITSGYEDDKEDTRLLFYGFRYIIENYVAVKWTLEDVEMAENFIQNNNTGFSFPKKLFIKFIEENDGYFPVKIEALPEGTSCHAKTPVFQITAEGEYAPLATFLEILISMTWYSTTVATLSRRARDIIEAAYEDTVDEDDHWSLEIRLRDFGFRGCTCLEQSIIGGSAHLLNFIGTSTMSAAYYVQFKLNNGNPVASAIPSTEHSIMTSHKSEQDALLKMIDRFGTGIYSCLMDTFDYVNALENILPSIASQKLEKGGFMILRPDSGDPVEVIMMALRAAEKVFGIDVNKKGYKIIRGCSVIQGDGVNIRNLKAIIKAAKEAGYSIQNISFGMGSGLLQKINSDTMSFATKLNHTTYYERKQDGTKNKKMKLENVELIGELVVKKNEQGVPIVYPKESCSENDPDNLLRVVYDHGKVFEWEDFDTIRKRVAKEWPALPKTFDNISPELKEKIDQTFGNLKSN
ncbi:6075_t:CDS:10 [Acaulospora morrowiae]|uniref:Nicotinamide phosphoribosyltransferase n=1 Tax=Acaulospora morrowiae TaxID=94023 RepID=A0A9N9BFZ2_9GLOM|nr:6075_t:CDS:10 [Acaulospora morrowiae]